MQSEFRAFLLCSHDSQRPVKEGFPNKLSGAYEAHTEVLVPATLQALGLHGSKKFSVLDPNSCTFSEALSRLQASIKVKKALSS